MNRLASSVATLASSLACASAFGQTVIPGGNIANQNWTAAGSPYIVQGDVTVPGGAFLVIEDGAEVRAAANSDSQGAGLDPAKVEITAANGSTLEIRSGATLRSATSVAGTWHGVVVNAGAAGSIAGTIQHAANGVAIHAQDFLPHGMTVTDTTGCGLTLTMSGVTATNVTLANVDRGVCSSAGSFDTGGVLLGNLVVTNATGCAVDLTDGDSAIFRARLTNVASGVCIHEGAYRVSVHDALIAGGGSGYGLHVDSTQTGPFALPYATVYFSTIDGFQAGASAEGGELVVYNSIVTNNSQYGLRAAAGSPKYGWTNTYANGTNVSGILVSEGGNISSDPLYANAAGGDFHLTPASPSANAANDTGLNPMDADGFARTYGYVNDMGAFELQAKANQRLAFGPFADRLASDPPFTASASSNSTLAATVSSLTLSTCTVSGNTVTLTGANGTCTLKASQAGDTYYFAAEATQGFQVTGVANPPRLANISTRAQVLTGADVMIAGFIIGGSTPKKVAVRARGPSLAQFGVAGPLPNPQLQLFSGSTQIAYNDDWKQAPNEVEIQASGWLPGSELESTILTTLSPGAYSAIVTGVGGTTGVAIVEVFEVDQVATPLVNIATRARVATGDNVMIAGIIIQGDGPQTVVVRARGPSLAQFNVPGLLADPTLQLFSGSTPIASNDNWGDAANAAAIQSSGFAPPDPNESAILLTLQPGAYTAIVSGVGATTGVAIVEVFRN